MAQRIRTFDRAGTLIKELSGPALCEWIINDIGSASFVSKAAGLEPYVRYGNYITVEHDNGLPDFVGVITTPRPWSSKTITVNAKSAMWLFAQRVGSYEQPVSGSFGEVITQVIGIVNAAESTILQIGTYDSGISYSSVVDMSNVYTYLQRALAQSNTRLDFRPVFSNGKLTIYIDMQPTLYTPSNLKLEEGLNLKKNSLILLEQGDIYNDVTILGVGLDQTKYMGWKEDPVSISLYGRRQVLFSEGTSQSDVDRLATVRLSQYAYPRNTLGLVALNVNNTFSNIREGYSGPVKLFSEGYLNNGLGFEGTAYIKSIIYDGRTKEANLVCLEV